MSAIKRLFTGGLILFGAATIWHAGATIGYGPFCAMQANVNPESGTVASLASVTMQRAGSDVQHRQHDRSDRLPGGSLGLIDDDLRLQFRSGRMGDRARGATQLTPDLIDAVLDIAEELDPEMASELRIVCYDDPREFERIMYTSGRRLLALADVKRNEPDLFKFKLDEFENDVQIVRKSEALRVAYHEGDEQRVEELQEQLHQLLTMQAGFMFGSHAIYLSRLQQRMDEHIAKSLQEMNDVIHDRERLVEERMQAIMDAIRTGDDLPSDHQSMRTINQ